MVSRENFALKISSTQLESGVAVPGGRGGLCEYISRSARSRLVHLLVERFGSVSIVAGRLGVSRAAVRKWLHPTSPHPPNSVLRRIAGLAARSDRAAAMGVLENDLLSHWILFERFASRGTLSRARPASAGRASS